LLRCRHECYIFIRSTKVCYVFMLAPSSELVYLPLHAQFASDDGDEESVRKRDRLGEVVRR